LPALQTHPGKPAAHGNPAPEPGKLLPFLLLAAQPPTTEAPLPELRAEPPADPDQLAAAPEPLVFADLALLQNFIPQLAVPPSRLAPAPPALRQLADTAMPAVPLAFRPAKARSAPEAERGVARSAAEPPESPAAPAAERPSIVASIPLARSQPARQPITLDIAPVLQPLLQLAEPPRGSSEAAPNLPVHQQADSPAIELGTVIDRLEETRIQSREGRSEVNVPHPDFGQVTLALSIAADDQLGIAMPDAPAELRSAVGQAFAPPPRSEVVPSQPAADGGMAGSADPRSQDTRRDPQSSGGRSDPSRATTDGERNRQFTTSSDNHRKPSGRGVLA
jgi:hypothetical protein